MPRFQEDLKAKWTQQEQGLYHLAYPMPSLRGQPPDGRTLKGAVGHVASS